MGHLPPRRSWTNDVRPNARSFNTAFSTGPQCSNSLVLSIGVTVTCHTRTHAHTHTHMHAHTHLHHLGRLDGHERLAAGHHPRVVQPVVDDPHRGRRVVAKPIDVVMIPAARSHSACVAWRWHCFGTINVESISIITLAIME